MATVAPKEEQFSATGGRVISKSDTQVIEPSTRGIWVGTGGDLRVRFIDGTDVVLNSVPDGTLLPLQVDMVFSTNTSASFIRALF